MRLTKKIDNVEAMIAIGKIIGTYAKPNMVIALNGDLGAGKTTLTKGIGQGLGIKRTINSPTFTIMKIYEGTMRLYHMDVYRINENSRDDDLEEYFERDGLSVVEWAENIAYLLPKNALQITIKITGDHSRTLEFVCANDDFSEMMRAFS
ncbi:MAG: tRNA (adenosine(37)-N6)-threonylcarbamoyltransferase complex ATPase subunit type 1 TsaE [Bacilli bacterium]|nr:tRNA (adenosine(37)-N6)-threonylcarbamoyltransferase complex ATPase subunit type 1 TsaE [Bacilli bacterium]